MKITKEMTIMEALNGRPEVAQVLFEAGIHCVGCHMAAEETIEQGLRAHGMDDKQIDETIRKMNEMLEKGKR